MNKKKISNETPMVCYRGLFRQFKVISAVKLTKEEDDNIVFIIKDEQESCERNVIAKDIVKSLQETNSEVKNCTLANEGKRLVVKVNVID